MEALSGGQPQRAVLHPSILSPYHRLATFFAARLRDHGILELVTSAICQLARQLEENGAPIDYARGRRLPRLSQARLDVTAWRRQRYILSRPATWRHHHRLDNATLPTAPVREHFARLRLIELLTGTAPATCPNRRRWPLASARDTRPWRFFG